MFKCAICQETLSHDQVSAIKCGHTFHFHCLCRWLQRSKSCPTCRIAVNSVNTDVITHVYLECQSLNSFLETSMSDDFEKKCLALESSLNQANDQILSKDKLINEIRSVLERTEREKSELERKSTSQIKTITVLRNKCLAFDGLQNENERLTKQNSSMKKKLDTLNKLNSLLNGSNEEAQNCLDDLSIESFDQTKLLLGVLKDRLREASDRNEKMEHELRRMRMKLYRFEKYENAKKLPETRMKKRLEDSFVVENDEDENESHVTRKLVTCKMGQRLKKAIKSEISDESNDENELPELRPVDVPSKDDEILGLSSGRSKKPTLTNRNLKPSKSTNDVLSKPDGLGGRARDSVLLFAAKNRPSTSGTSAFKRTVVNSNFVKGKKMRSNKKITAFSSRTKRNLAENEEIVISD